MSTLLAEQTTNSGGLNYYTNTARSCQTFTMPAGYDTVEYINLYIKNGGSYSGTFYLYLYATSGGLPTGSPLATATLSGGSISSSYGWVTFDISDTLVSAGSKYAIVCYANGSSSLSNGVYWGHNNTDAYSGGGSYNSTNSGSSYSTLSETGHFKFMESSQLPLLLLRAVLRLLSERPNSHSQGMLQAMEELQLQKEESATQKILLILQRQTQKSSFRELRVHLQELLRDYSQGRTIMPEHTLQTLKELPMESWSKLIQQN